MVPEITGVRPCRRWGRKRPPRLEKLESGEWLEGKCRRGRRTKISPALNDKDLKAATNLTNQDRCRALLLLASRDTWTDRSWAIDLFDDCANYSLRCPVKTPHRSLLLPSFVYFPFLSLSKSKQSSSVTATARCRKSGDSKPVEFESYSVMTVSNSASGEASASSENHAALAFLPPPAKKKRNLPGMPDPEAEVIVLSPKTLMATNRFVCEICNKGFQRDQNLQLHRRGHNLPWKLRQRTGKEVKKRVYVCPEPSCVHHDPSRALGDLTGIKKHFCRKHGEKKWKCDKCSKKYAVQSDWKAHAKTCGTREYRCDCGTLFSRRDSYVTHLAFCDALAEESARAQGSENRREEKAATAAAAPASLQEQRMVSLPMLPDQKDRENSAVLLRYMPPLAPASMSVNCNNSSGSTTSCAGSTLFASSVSTTRTSFSDLIGGTSRTEAEPPSLCLSSNGPSSLFPPAPDRRQFAAPPPSAHMSATALLQKAAQMGAAASSSSFLRGFGLPASSSPSATGSELQWPEQTSMSAGLGLGLRYDGGGAAGLPGLMMSSANLFESKPAATLDFLGLGMGTAGSSNAGGLSAFINSIGAGGLEAYGGGRSTVPAKAWDGSGGDREPNGRAIL
ncbi:Zinc finger protein MAGPIE [Platanthera zijinensis]|uniref:Protein EARLY HEADING DATE 2 n=1 Tax=Platanthera zijinensis TaxID=2320716 RepID=A0AAP0G4Y2_9ASPA